MGSEKTTSDLAAARTAVRNATAEVQGALREAWEEVAGAQGQVALIQEVVRTVTDVDTIKALADSTRLAILRALSHDRVPKSAKELAEDLDQPQTKLYRHLKVLQEAGLIEPAETRVVSGIVETKYRAMQSGVAIDPSKHYDEAREAVARMIGGNLDDYRERILRTMAVKGSSADPEEIRRLGRVMNLSATIPVELADDFQRRLEALVEEFSEFPRDPDGVRIEALVSWFRPERPEGREARPGPGSA